jgi:hypothetical protein
MTRVDQTLARPFSVLALAMHGLTFIQCCVVCRRPWIACEERWRAYYAGDEPSERAELVFYCPECAEREFDSTRNVS